MYDDIPGQNPNSQSAAPHAVQNPNIINNQPVLNHTNSVTNGFTTPQQPTNILQVVPKPKKSHNVKIIVGILGIVTFLIFAGLAFLLFKAATNKIVLNGEVLDENNVAIRDAKIFLNDAEITTTDASGIFQLSNLETGDYTIKITATNFPEFTETLRLEKSLFNSTYSKTFIIQSGKASLSGKFISSTEGYNFLDDMVTVNNQEYDINPDGSFTVNGLNEGEAQFSFRSINFRNIDRNITLKPGMNNISDVNVEATGDIKGSLVSYIKEDFAPNLNIQVSNVAQDKIKIDELGEFSIEDLEIGTEYDIRISSPTNAYEPRDYKITVKRGLNQIFDLKVVETGNAIYALKPKSEDINLYKSDYDGAEQVQLTTNEDLKPYNYYYNTTENKIYFLTEIDRTRSAGSGNTPLVYIHDLATNAIEKITTNTSNLGDIIPVYKSKAFLNIYEVDRNDEEKLVIEVRDLTGNVINSVKETAGIEYVELFLSANLKYLYTLEENEETEERGIYVTDLDTKQSKLITNRPNLQIYDVSDTGKRIIFAAQDEDLSFDNLYIYDHETSEIRNIITNHLGKMYQFLNGSDVTMVYSDNINKRDNLYRIQVDQNQSEELTKLAANDEIKNVYQQNGYIFYLTERGLFVLDPLKPLTYKKVVEGEISF